VGEAIELNGVDRGVREAYGGAEGGWKTAFRQRCGGWTLRCKDLKEEEVVQSGK